LVVRQRFGWDGSAWGAPELFPARVRTKQTTPEAIGRDIVKDPHHILLRGARLIGHKAIPLPAEPAPPAQLRRLACSIVETYAIFANSLAAEWALKEHVPIIQRTYSPLYDGPVINANELYRVVDGEHDPNTYGTPYAWISSALRRGIDTMNQLNIGHAMANKAPVFTPDMLGKIAVQFNTPHAA
jgi:hypothetical protein